MTGKKKEIVWVFTGYRQKVVAMIVRYSAPTDDRSTQAASDAHLAHSSDPDRSGTNVPLIC
jgi:hypothetical protein